MLCSKGFVELTTQHCEWHPALLVVGSQTAYCMFAITAGSNGKCFQILFKSINPSMKKKTLPKLLNQNWYISKSTEQLLETF